jgi:hypothetical protein
VPAHNALACTYSIGCLVAVQHPATLETQARFPANASSLPPLFPIRSFTMAGSMSCYQAATVGPPRNNYPNPLRYIWRFLTCISTIFISGGEVQGNAQIATHAAPHMGSSALWQLYGVARRSRLSCTQCIGGPLAVKDPAAWQTQVQLPGSAWL